MKNVIAITGKRVEDAKAERKHKTRTIESFPHGNVLAQISQHRSEDGVLYRTFTIDRMFETADGLRKGELMLTAEGIRDFQKAFRAVKKWRRNDIRERRRRMWRKKFG